VKGILADNNVVGQVEYLVRLMQEPIWADFWVALGLTLYHFEDLGLTATAKDTEIWRLCQAQELMLITDNRNDDSPESMVVAIRTLNTPTSLPIFTIADLDKFGESGEYEARVVARLYDYLIRIDEVRGTGRLFLP
jgi:predicted nuclease of predicted toxin-antitoxin system